MDGVLNPSCPTIEPLPTHRTSGSQRGACATGRAVSLVRLPPFVLVEGGTGSAGQIQGSPVSSVDSIDTNRTPMGTPPTLSPLPRPRKDLSPPVPSASTRPFHGSTQCCPSPGPGDTGKWTDDHRASRRPFRAPSGSDVFLFAGRERVGCDGTHTRTHPHSQELREKGTASTLSEQGGSDLDDDGGGGRSRGRPPRAREDLCGYFVRKWGP